MSAAFNQKLEGIRRGEVKVLNLGNKHIGNGGVLPLSMALMTESNKVITLDLSMNKIGVQGVKSLITALMNEITK